MADDAPRYETPYLMQLPDGSTQSRVLHTDRPITHGEVADYVAGQGGVYMGPPAPPEPTEAPPPPAAAPELVGPSPYVPPEVQRMSTPGVEAQWAAERQRLSPMPPAPGPAPVPSPPPDLVRAATGYDLGGGAPLAGAFAPPPPPAPPAPAAPVPVEQSPRDVYFPGRSFTSQLPSVAGAVTLGTLGTAAATPLGPELQIPIGMGAAGLGSAAGEGLQIAGEKILGAEPAEPGTVTQRMGNAFVRGATFELPAQALRYFPALAVARATPAAEAAEELRPILTGSAEVGPTAGKASEVLKPGYALPRWWQSVSQGTPDEIVQAWKGLGAEGQRAVAGEHFDAMQTVMKTLAAGEKGWSPWGFSTSLVGAPAVWLKGSPVGAVASLFPAAREFVREGVPALAADALRSPQAVPWLIRVPKVARVAGPMVMVPTRAASQSL